MRTAPLLAAATLFAAIVIARTPAQTGVQRSEPAIQTMTGELTEKLDSKTAKIGDRVVIKTRAETRLGYSGEIPKGSKLIAHVAGVKPAGAGEANAQIALAFDRIELKNGVSLPIRGQIESIVPAEPAPDNAPELMAAAPSNGSAGRASGDMYGSTPSITAPSEMANQSQVNEGSPGAASGLGSSSDSNTRSDRTAIVARSGNLTIRATTIPGLLVANRESDSAGLQNSSILLGARRDISLEKGTRFEIEVASTMPSGSAKTN